MARKTRAKPLPTDSTKDDLDVTESEVDPYAVLALEKCATQDQIKSAYRKAALKFHPDKAQPSDKEEANRKFQEIAFAYAILSDERRRKRYDTTGNTAESLNVDDDDFDWVDYFREQTAAMVDPATIQKIKNEYQGSEEERQDVLDAYRTFKGNMDAVYEQIMCSNVLEDDERLRRYIDEAVASGDAEVFTAYSKETKAKKKGRIARAREEEEEAMQLADELGVRKQLFGKEKKTKGAKKTDDQAGLLSLIQQRQKDRSEDFFSQLEAKYGGQDNKKSKRKADEPPEHLFQQNAKRGKTSI